MGNLTFQAIIKNCLADKDTKQKRRKVIVFYGLLSKESFGWFICSNSTFAFISQKTQMNCGKWAFSNKRSNSSQEPL